MVGGAEEELLAHGLEAFGLIETEEVGAVGGHETGETMMAAVAPLADGVDH